MRRHDNRDRSRCPHGGLDRWDKMGDDDIDAKPDEFFSELLGTITSPVGVAELDLDVLAFRIAELQTAPERISERVRRRRRHQYANMGQFSWLLCARPERPACRRAAEQRDERAACSYSACLRKTNSLRNRASSRAQVAPRTRDATR